MNIHEYQAKQLFADSGVAVPAGSVARSEEEFDQALASLPADSAVVVKAQIHAGGRGKGTFKDGFQGGVHILGDHAEAKEKAAAMLGNVLVTKQTGEEGREVKTVYFTEATDIEKEFYLAILMDRATSRPVVIASTEGGVDIEEVAESSPEKILKAEIDPLVGAQPFQGRDLAFRLGLSGVQVKQFVNIFMGLAKLFADKDLALIEVNPLVITDEGNLHCLDAKVVVDSNALYRQPELEAMHDPSQEDEREAHAAQWELNYVALDGSIGCMVNGAGLAMGTMDIVKLHGGAPANFLDVGGGATKERVTEAFKIILSDENVKAVLINIFGGIVRCDLIAEGVIGAVEEVGVDVPVVVRLEGNNAALGREVLAGSGLNIQAAESLTDAAQKVVAAAGGAS